MPKDRQFIESAEWYGERLVEFLNDPQTDQFPNLNRGQTGYEQADLWPFFFARLIRNCNWFLDRGAICSHLAIRGAVAFTRLQETLIMALRTAPGIARIRQCACGCERWFVVRTQKQRFHNAACRNKLWEQKMTQEQRERRRLRMKRSMAVYYNRNFKAE